MRGCLGASTPSSCAFSLIELLIVVAIIALLVSIALPSLRRAREAARETVCQSNLHQFGVAITAFALDHQEHLPGVYTWREKTEWKRDWLSGSFGSISNQRYVWANAPESGTLFDYVGRTRGVYRCPSQAVGEVGTGVGGNGRYDYTMIGGFGGARLDKFPVFMSVDKVSQPSHMTPVPFFVEENPEQNLNSALAGSFATSDELARRHFDLSSFTAMDASVQRWPSAYRFATGNDLLATPITGPSRQKSVIVGIDPSEFGWWNRQ